MKILFSPVGGTDPISEDNGKDGSLLHICRYYQPDKVVLYLSNEMLRKEEKDQRYTKSIGLIADLLGKEIEYEIIRRPKLVKAHEYDFFYEDFRKCIHKLAAELKDPDDTLLINTSSGTPAMKSALIVMQTIVEIKSIAIQVETPTHKMNDHNHADDYDLDDYWKKNPDNTNNENRCREISCPNLSVMRDEQIIKKLVNEYYYAPALLMAQSLPMSDTDRYYKLLEMAKERYDLNWKRAQEIERELGQTFFFPGKDQKDRYLTDAERDIVEYILLLDIKVKRGDYADFLRAITPVLFALYKIILSDACSVNLDDYILLDAKGLQRWNKEKVKETEIGKILSKTFEGHFNYGPVYSSHLVPLIEALSQDKALTKITNNLYDVEQHVRNPVAHELVRMTDVDVQRRSGRNSAGIMNLIRKLITYTSICGKVDWKVYDKMNKEIIKAIGS